MTALAAAPPRSPTAPALRQDLEVIEGAPDIHGARRWLIYDPLQHRFIAIGRNAYALLQVWREGKTVEALVADAWNVASESLQPADVTKFIGFLHASRLTVEPPEGGWRALAAAQVRQRGTVAHNILHSYLFFRIPLVRPERTLRATLDYVRPLGTLTFGLIISMIGMAGFYLVSREWDAFRATFAGVATLEGAALLGLALMLVKLFHELGHAYVATAHGCRVPVIGVAVILGAPLLYCDVTDAWRLKSRMARLQVDMAGIAADLAVACVATFLWAFLPPGLLKHFAFSLATAGWALSLAMNLNPFMKFDGYHIASDIIGVENMQDRAMALGRWKLREVLFRLQAPSPERLPRDVALGLIGYAWALWLYRLVMFTGIALVVYGLFFKLAGVLLFAVEIGYFIVAPVLRELREWWRMRKAILKSPRTFVTAGIVAALIILAITPLSSEVRIPAVLEASRLMRLYPALPAKIEAVHVAHGDRVTAGARLVSLASSDLLQEIELNRLKAEVVALRQARRTSDVTDREEAMVLDNEMAALQQQRDGLSKQRRELDIVAPFAGHVVELTPGLHQGRWLNPHEPVAVVRGDGDAEVRGALSEQDLWRLSTGARARFIPDDLGLPSVSVRVDVIALAAMAVLDQPELASSHGGRVADRPDQRHQAIPVTAQYGVRGRALEPLPDAYASHGAAGVLIAEGRAESAVSRAWRQVLKVLVRESAL